MHFHAEHALFFESRQPLWRSAASLATATGVLILNAGAGSTTLSLAGSGMGCLLLAVAYVRGHRRLEPVLTWTLALVACALLGGIFLRLETDAFLNTASRISCGVIWVLWLGTQLDWASLRQILVALRVPFSVVSSLDHALLHGVLTKGEWTRRRDAARLRVGATRLPMTSWGQLLGEGALQAFLRLEDAEESAILRSSSSPPGGGARHFTSTPSDWIEASMWFSIRSTFAWQPESGCSCADRAGPGSRACCACSPGWMAQRRGS